MAVIDCGIDIGSTNVKVVLVAEDGRVLHKRTTPTPRAQDAFGIVTDPLQLVITLEGLIIEGWWQVAGGIPLRSITTAGVGEDGVTVNADLQPLGHSIPWFDKRATAEVQSLRRYDNLVSRTGIAIDETRTAAKWLWLHNHRFHELDKSSWLTLTDFPIAWWAGKSYMSSSLAPRTACFDIHTRTWVDALLAATHAPNLPSVLNAGTVVGGVRHGPLRESGAASSETLLVAGGHDHPIAATIIRRFDPSARVDSMGTANLVYGETPVFDDISLAKTLAFSIPPSGPGFACLGVLELSAALANLPDGTKLRDYLAQAHLPGQPPKSVFETSDGNSEAAMRRVLERLSFDARRLLSTLDQAVVPAGRIYTTGGWSRSKAFVELRASVFGQPIVALGDLELTAEGAAILGAEAATGKPQNRLQAHDMITIEPLPAWAAAYEDLFSTLT